MRDFSGVIAFRSISCPKNFTQYATSFLGEVVAFISQYPKSPNDNVN